MLGSPVRVRPVAPLLICAGLLSGLASGVEDTTKSIFILPAGKVPQRTIDALKTELGRTYDAKVTILDFQALPKSAYFAPRERYRADKLIDWSDKLGLKSTKTIIVTSVDISATARGHDDWGVFGLGSVGGHSCVVSSFRLKGSLPNLVKVAIHEIGHTLGLDHCPTFGCVMQDAEGTIRTLETENGKFCPRCQRIAGKWLTPAAK